MLHGSYSAIMQDEDGQILEAHSISAGLDYPGTGPEHAHLRDTGRARYVAVTDDGGAGRASAASRELEGIIPALESSHAVAWALGQGREAAGRTRSTSSASPAAATRTSPRCCPQARRSREHATGTGRSASPRPSPAAAGRAALMPYLMGGFPDLEASVAIGEAYADGGADLVELGVPFSDPLADGPVIHAAGTARAGAPAPPCTACSRSPRGSPSALPVVLMCYANLVLARGVERFAAELAARRRQRPDRARPAARGGRRRVLAACDAAGVALVPLVAPTTPDDRLAAIGAGARGFVYTVSVDRARPASGPASSDSLARRDRPREGAQRRPRRRRLRHLDARAGRARRPTPGADGVIVGSRLVRAAAEAADAGAAARAPRSARWSRRWPPALRR